MGGSLSKHPDATTVGRYWRDDDSGKLWLQEFADHSIISFIPGDFAPNIERLERPERKLIVTGDSEHGLRLLDEPIRETLQREREG